MMRPSHSVYILAILAIAGRVSAAEARPANARPNIRDFSLNTTVISRDLKLS